MAPTDGTELEIRRHHEKRTASRPGWLAEVREMRGRVLYDQGRRPSFRMADGSFNDPDPIDLKAYHVIARFQGRLVGCTRIVPLAEVESTAVLSTIGKPRFEAILQSLGATRELTCEASRWIVDSEYRGRLGPALVAATWAVAHWLSAEFTFMLAGTHDRQDLALLRLGAHSVNGLPLFPEEAYDDELRLLYVSYPSEWMRRQMMEAAAALDLGRMMPPIRRRDSGPVIGSVN